MAGGGNLRILEPLPAVTVARWRADHFHPINWVETSFFYFSPLTFMLSLLIFSRPIICVALFIVTKEHKSFAPIGILEYWNIGILEYWNTGILEYWSVGVLGLGLPLG